MISVVIPAYNEEKNVARCLEAFLYQKTTQEFEVILVDNNSTDKTVAIAKTFLDKLPLRIVAEKEKGRGHARAAGFEAAKGDRILSTDADAVVPPDWIEKMAEALKDSNVVAVAGSGEMIAIARWKQQCVRAILPFAIWSYKRIHGHYCLFGFNFGIRKNAYKEAGGFRKVNGLEDLDLGFRVQHVGKISYKPIFVAMSGRRFDTNILQGVLSYIVGYIDYHVRKKEDFFVSDIRE